MKDFGRWLADMADDLADTPDPIHRSRFVPDLPYEVVQVKPGYYEAQCRVCSEWCDIYCDPADFDPDMHYCGRSPGCCP